MISVLYITYDGLLEPLGQSQVLAYLALLAEDHRVHILSFEKKTDRNDRAAMEAVTKRLRKLDIGWTPLPYHKTPSAPATALDICVGMVAGFVLALRTRAGIVHVRSYVPALMAMPIRRLTGAKMLFDMRGFWADERVEGGLWPRQGMLYRVAKSLESRFLRAADHIVTLTDSSARELRNFDALRGSITPITVIPTCADLSLFRPGRPPGSPFVFGYVGSVGTWYLFEETLAFFRALLRRRPDARFLIVNRKEHDLILQLADKAGISRERIELVSATHDEVPAYVRRMHLGAALIRPSFSKIASAPTKIGEYLGSGVPCLGNTGVGDVAEILRTRNVGVALDAFDPAAIEAGVDEALSLIDDPTLQARCAAAANDLFSLEHGVAAYRQIYQSLMPRALVGKQA